MPEALTFFVLMFAPCATDWCVTREALAVAAYDTAEDCQHVADAIRQDGAAWCEPTN